MSTKVVAIAPYMNDAGAFGIDPTDPGIVLGDGNPGLYFGSGAPTFAAAKGSVYMNTAGSTTNDRLYVCSVASGTWVAVTTAS